MSALTLQHFREAVRDLKNQLPDIIQLEVPLAPLVGYRVGGPADALAKPRTREQLQEILRFCSRYQVPFFILGQGANVLIADEGVPGVVIQLHRCCHELVSERTRVYAGTGRLLSDLVFFCETHGLAGLELLSGIPGTVGGALRMNAGAFGREIGDKVETIEAFDKTGRLMTISKKEAGFGYRRADGIQDKILLGAWLQLESGDPETLRQTRETILQRRAEKQPLEYPSCGSVFKRPPGDYAGRLIEAAGLKGFRIGNAQVSEKHANFIVNLGNATARDIFNTIQAVQEKVYQQFGVWLELEVKLVGFTAEEIEKTRRPSNG